MGLRSAEDDARARVGPHLGVAGVHFDVGCHRHRPEGVHGAAEHLQRPARSPGAVRTAVEEDGLGGGDVGEFQRPLDPQARRRSEENVVVARRGARMPADLQRGAFGHHEFTIDQGGVDVVDVGRDEIRRAGVVQGRAPGSREGPLGPVQGLGDVQDPGTGDRAPSELQDSDRGAFGERRRRISDIHGATGHFQYADAPAIIQDELARAHADGGRADAADSFDLTRHTHGAVTAALIAEHDAGTEKQGSRKDDAVVGAEIDPAGRRTDGHRPARDIDRIHAPEDGAGITVRRTAAKDQASREIIEGPVLAGGPGRADVHVVGLRAITEEFDRARVVEHRCVRGEVQVASRGIAGGVA